MITKITDIKFPPVGGTKPYLVTANGAPYASFETSEEAHKARGMYSQNGNPQRKEGTANMKLSWAVCNNPATE